MGIRESRERHLREGSHLSYLVDEKLTPAQRLYMHNTSDPTGIPWREAYYSFRKGQAARLAEAERIADLFNVTVEHLEDGAMYCMARMICRLN